MYIESQPTVNVEHTFQVNSSGKIQFHDIAKLQWLPSANLPPLAFASAFQPGKEPWASDTPRDPMSGSTSSTSNV